MNKRISDFDRCRNTLMTLLCITEDSRPGLLLYLYLCVCRVGGGGVEKVREILSETQIHDGNM